MTKSQKIFFMLLPILILVTFLVSLNTGVIKIAPLDVLKTFIGYGTDQDELVLFSFRLPRMVLALLIGAGMAVAGAILQGVTRNDLADPGIIGINAGAGFAVVLYLYLVSGNAIEPNALTIYTMPIFALVGAGLAAFLIYLFAMKGGVVTPSRLILVGIGIAALFGACLIVIQLRMDPRDFMKATVWLTGSIWGANWTYVLSLLPWIVVLLPLAFYRARYLNVLNLGDSLATGLGTHVEKERRLMLFIAVALAGSSVSVGGGISFLGLIAPHIARKVVGPRHQFLLPAAALTGALLLLFSDYVSRVLIAPSSIPVGIVVAFLGAPYFIYLLIKTP
ncbi:FecCD family ABC transporter permease [Mangrovibacillus cuniculi]|uniref:Iron ABC transporter permease n=1 Tax=Mangrovibacillus cuniculi TaxID=2593652 RepID=A0A7S8HGQ6_9BACI|nr:iron ABC transporter permease [Mangrovibacillus cuniculi]QPC48143.1 iron ABC transporter permease [Mangrovibacillus cuniculi]